MSSSPNASPIQQLYPDLDSELASTRKLLERYPDGKVTWTPHDKSMPLGPLASHIADLPGLGVMLLENDQVDVAARPRRDPAANSTELLKRFDENVANLNARVSKASAADLDKTWKLVFGDKVLVSEKRSVLMRTLLINHIIHHRAQLGVYYRLMGIPVPGTYGPSADEPVGM